MHSTDAISLPVLSMSPSNDTHYFYIYNTQHYNVLYFIELTKSKSHSQLFSVLLFYMKAL